MQVAVIVLFDRSLTILAPVGQDAGTFERVGFGFGFDRHSDPQVEIKVLEGY